MPRLVSVDAEAGALYGFTTSGCLVLGSLKLSRCERTRPYLDQIASLYANGVELCRTTITSAISEYSRPYAFLFVSRKLLLYRSAPPNPSGVVVSNTSRCLPGIRSSQSSSAWRAGCHVVDAGDCPGIPGGCNAIDAPSELRKDRLRIMTENVTFVRGICRQRRGIPLDSPRSGSVQLRGLSRSPLEAILFGVLLGSPQEQSCCVRPIYK